MRDGTDYIELTAAKQKFIDYQARRLVLDHTMKNPNVSLDSFTIVTPMFKAEAEAYRDDVIWQANRSASVPSQAQWSASSTRR